MTMSDLRKNSINALIVCNYLSGYTEFENFVKNEFLLSFEQLKSEYKNRIYFYVGGILSNESYIEYDTYSFVKQINKYDKDNVVKKLTMNHIIKLERKENEIEKFKKRIPSIQHTKVELFFCDCCVKLINTRNKLAHEFFNLNLKNNDIIEVLSKENFEQNKPKWLQNVGYDELDENMIGIVCNYIYMDILKEALKEEDK